MPSPASCTKPTEIRPRRTLRLIAAAGLLLMSAAPSVADRAVSPVCPANQLISNPAMLERAIVCAFPGATLKLAANAAFGTLDLRSVAANRLTIASSDPKRPARFDGISLLDSSGLTLRDLAISGAMPQNWTSALQIRRSRQITVQNLTLTGPEDAMTTDSGVMVKESVDIAIRRLIITRYRHGITLFNVREVRVSENALYGLVTDGIRGGGIEQAVIERNLIANLNPAPGGHADGIQFWSRNQKTASQDIAIRQNLMIRGSGQPFQGIFVRDSVNLPFRRLEIAGNAVIGGNFHGISVNGADGVTASRNIVVPIAPQLSWLRLQNTTNSEAVGNKAGKFLLRDQAAGRNNEVINLRRDATRDLRAWLAGNRLTSENFPVAVLEGAILRGG